jgi:hypothetical protein
MGHAVEDEVDPGHDLPAALGDESGALDTRVNQQHRELLAAEAGDEVVPTQQPGESIGHGDQDMIAGGVAESIVDLLEVIEVEHQAGDGQAIA